jgi:hypothetical protein
MSRATALVILGTFGIPERGTVNRAPEAERQGKGPSTQAGEFVRAAIW